jgi:predicted nucleic acid-binding Zn ribbon protein
MSLEDRYQKIMDDPKKRVRAFKAIWLISYSMLMFGAVMIIYVLLIR